MRTLPSGTTIGPYVVESEVARGAMGAVYRARRVQDGAVVALKVLSAGPGATESQLERFRREGEVAARLTHPGVVRVLDAGTVSWLSYIAMDLIDGDALSASVGRVAPLEAARLIAQVARAVEDAHQHGVVHRDLKPGNVLVRRHDGRALVTDFGIARDLTASALTKTGAMVGTPTYFSPEQAAGRPVTAASDVHALGVLLFELVTGVPPFRRDDLPSMLVAIADEAPEPPSALRAGVPAELDRICRAALKKRPAERPTAGEVADALEALVEGRRPPGARRLPTRLLLAAGALALVALGALLIATQPAAPDTDAASTAPTTTARRARQVRPPPEPPWVEPAWLRAVAARGDTPSLLEAHAALDAAPQVEVDARTRARAVVVLSAMDARWTEPKSNAMDAGDTLDHLLWQLWLRKRVDPDFVLPPARRRLLDSSSGWALGLPRGPDYLPHVGRATAALMPDVITGYLIYATSAHPEPTAARNGDLLREGLDVAVATKDQAWGTIATRYVTWLTYVVQVARPDEVAAAKDALTNVCRQADGAGARLDPGAAAGVLIRGAELELGGPDEWSAFLLRAEALDGPSAAVSCARATHLGRRAKDPAARTAAALEAERALDLLTTRGTHENQPTRVGGLVCDLWLRAEQRPRALAALERALTLEGRLPGLAARRLGLLLDDPSVPEAALAAAVGDLVTHLTGKLADPGLGNTAYLEGALKVARAAATAPTLRPTFVESLRRLTTPEALAQLDLR